MINERVYKSLGWKIVNGLIFLAILTGLSLSVLSWLNLCTEACGDVHSYRFYGISFETIGIPFFLLALCFLIASWTFHEIYRHITAFLIASALGAEAYLIYVQKYIIGHWCPVCLGIAACVGIAALGFIFGYAIRWKNLLKIQNKELKMKELGKGVLACLAVIMGFLTVFLGVAKFDQLQAVQEEVKEKIAFGNLSSPIEVYVFTDWACPACREIEPRLENLAPAIMDRARLIFVDFAIHPETLNYIPYNLAFMINNKKQYITLRHALGKLAEKNGSPTEDQVEKIIKPYGVVYEPLNYSEIALGNRYYKEIVQKFQVKRTPTVVIINKYDRRGKRLTGVEDITGSKIMSAIDQLEKKN